VAVDQFAGPIGLTGNAGVQNGLVFRIDVAVFPVKRRGQLSVSLALRVKHCADVEHPRTIATGSQRLMKGHVRANPSRVHARGRLSDINRYAMKPVIGRNGGRFPFDVTVLDRGPKESGGTHEDVLTSQAFEPKMKELAAALKSQHKVVYSRPEMLIPPEKFEVKSIKDTIEMSGGQARHQAVR